MSTIRDVAAEAGVSVATVSRVMNGSARVAPHTREAVGRAVRELNFVPSANACSLSTGRTHTIGLCVPEVTNPYFAELVDSIERESDDRGYSVLLCNSGGYGLKEARFVRRARALRVDGIIICSGSTQETQVPVVFVDGTPFEGGVVVTCDNLRGAYMAVRHLTGQGHTNIAIITGPLERESAVDRRYGYEKALIEAGLVPNEALSEPGNYELEGGYRAARSLLGLGQRPTAIFASNDNMAVGALMALKEAGLRVPDDMAVVGFDDVLLSRFTSPTLTTVAQPKSEMGRLALELLVRAIEDGGQPAPQRLVLEPRLVVRESSVLGLCCGAQGRELPTRSALQSVPS